MKLSYVTVFPVWLLVSLCGVLGHVRAQLVSPCPRLFSYEPQKENDKWYGVVTLISESDLNGVWLRLILDRPSLQLGNWFGEIVTMDNKEYLVKNRNHKLKANMPYALRFYIKYNPSEPAPQLIAFRLNAKTVCPEGESITQAPIVGGQLQTSNNAEAPTGGSQPAPPQWSRPPPTPSTGNTNTGSEVFTRPGGGWTPPPSTDDDDDVFLGDFQLINRPQAKPMADFECGTVVTSGRDKRQTSFDSGYRHYQSRPHVYYYNYDVRQSPLNEFYQYLLSVLNYWSVRVRQVTYRIPDPEVQPRPLITYGQVTSEGEFPWHAALYHERGADLQYICGASLVARNYVITVAHCVTRRKTHSTLKPESLVVYLGKYYLKKWSNPGIQDSQVEKIIPHPDYKSDTYANDLALIKLVNPVSFTDYVRPICLWEGDQSLDNVVNKPGTVVGWGFDHTGKVTEELTQANMPIVSKETCIYSFPDFFSRFTTNKTYCAGFRNGTSVCNGDSGGGMVFLKPTSTPTHKVWQLRGLVSISVALQNQFRCDASHYVVFTDVAQYLDWIRTEVAK